ncbi:unnamed protein product [Amoebophrya sp. A120]|nr:unnamed protein product [Amoebophrya sp. A120]|eukprot:GSA120T00012284001.1
MMPGDRDTADFVRNTFSRTPKNGGNIHAARAQFNEEHHRPIPPPNFINNFSDDPPLGAGPPPKPKAPAWGVAKAKGAQPAFVAKAKGAQPAWPAQP